tara:strand:- start:67 stop:1818 length:1752 start_codon:yes stop_codon:yes gene_type:complete
MYILKVFTLKKFTVLLIKCFLFNVIVSQTNPCGYVSFLNDISICFNDSANIVASGGISYAWYPNYNISDTSISNPQVFNHVDTTYYVEITDNNGCVITDSVTVSVNMLPSVNAQGIDTICDGFSTQLIATGALSYNWSPTHSLTNSSIPYPSANPNTNTNYIVTGTDANGCANRDTISVVVLPLPNVEAGNDTTICPGLSVQLNATGGDTYQWLTTINLSNYLIPNPVATPNTSTNYMVRATDVNGCANTDTVRVVLHDSANADAGFSVSACYGDAIQLNASGGISYSWEPNYFLNHPTLANPLAFPNDDMVFTVQVTDSNGCIDFDSLNISVFVAHAGDDAIICKGDSILRSIGGDPATTFNWSPTDGVSDPTIYNPTLSPSIPTQYIVNIENAGGCNYIDTVFIDVSNPIPTFDTILNPGCNGVLTEFVNTSNSEFGFTWNFSDGDYATNDKVKKVFDFGSSFSATLTVQDSLNCTNSIDINIYTDLFENYFDIYYPNVFTPNSDGENDLFIVEVPGRINQCTELIIYNRFGEIQFISTGNNLKWDGRNNVGLEVPNGEYFFTLNVKSGFFSQSGTLYKFQ